MERRPQVPAVESPSAQRQLALQGSRPATPAPPPPFLGRVCRSQETLLCLLRVRVFVLAFAHLQRSAGVTEPCIRRPQEVVPVLGKKQVLSQSADLLLLVSVTICKSAGGCGCSGKAVLSP